MTQTPKPTINNNNQSISWSFIPVCCAKTQTSHIEVANIGNAINCLNVSIHCPGLGSRFINFGLNESTKYGIANPNPNAPKIAKLIDDD